MKKIPSLFERNYDGDRLVNENVTPGCEWVINGEGVATRKWDGTACMIQDGILYKRYDAKIGKRLPPVGFFPTQEPDEKTGHWPGWVPVTDSSEDKWHREAFARMTADRLNGTYELVGPKINGNKENLDIHVLLRHGKQKLSYDPPPTDFEGLKTWFADKNLEGIVWHHPDRRMAKIKKKDFGYKW